MPTHWWAGKKCIQHAVWLKAMTRDLNNPLGDIQPLSIPLFIFQRASEYMERERVPHVFPWRWGNGVLWACAGPWLFACWRDRSSLPGHFASYPPLVLSAVHSFAVRNALDGIPQAAWPPPYSCWLQTLTLLSPPSLDQSTPPTPASPMGSIFMLLQSSFWLWVCKTVLTSFICSLLFYLSLWASVFFLQIYFLLLTIVLGESWDKHLSYIYNI